MSNLPLVVGFGGFNAAGRSSGHQAYYRTIYESLSDPTKQALIGSLANLMGIENDPGQVLAGTLVRRIEAGLFDVTKARLTKKVDLHSERHNPAVFQISARDLPTSIPENWQLDALDEEGRQYRVTLTDRQSIKLDTFADMPVQAAGQLPSGFDPGSFYRSQHHPRGLQLTVLGASDAVHSLGIKWQSLLNYIKPDDIAVYSSSVMSQLDQTGFGGMINARHQSARVTSKQLALGLNTMPADFINAYVLGSVGATGGVTGACATFLYNLKQGVEDIKAGRRKVVLVGSSEAPILPEIIDGYAAMSALATDADLRKLDTTETPDYRRASRPFGENCGFTLAESSQYVILMADDLAIKTGAIIYAAVPSVFVNADGYKKSISAPGPGNYITMAKAVGLARNLLGENAVKNESFVQAHGSSTPQNRVTESKIFDEVAKAFSIEQWPVAAVKAYVGHSLGPASGDQLANTLGVFEHGILPGIKTITETASDVYAQRLNISPTDQELNGKAKIAFLNSKGFGGNNATATVFAPTCIDGYLAKKYSSKELSQYQDKCETTRLSHQDYIDRSNSGQLDAIYEFGNSLIDESALEINPDSMTIPGFNNKIELNTNEGFDEF